MAREPIKRDDMLMVRGLLWRTKVTQAQVAARLGMSRSALNERLGGRRNVSETFAADCRAAVAALVTEGTETPR